MSGSNSSTPVESTWTRCPSRSCCKRAWRQFLKRTESRYVFASAVVSTNCTSSISPTPSSRCNPLGMSRRTSREPGGIQTAGTRFYASHFGLRPRNHPLTCDHIVSFVFLLAVITGAKSGGEANPSDPVPNLCTTKCSPSVASRLGYVCSE